MRPEASRLSSQPVPDKENRRRVKVEILGDVQGVGFRFFAEAHARRLGLHGYVRNRYDGAVEIVAEGEANDLDRFIELVRGGPRLARVREVRLSWSGYRGDLGPFAVRG